jgi:DNA replicative helicase MCM subunit Mcm2 (Cdc46/Mcm family)
MQRRLHNEDGNNSSNNTAKLEVDVAHLGEYDGSLLGFLREQPATILPTLELAASDALNNQTQTTQTKLEITLPFKFY